jgi:hypothetical protein
MSTPEPRETLESRALDALVDEARTHLQPSNEPDWSRIEAKVLAPRPRSYRFLPYVAIAAAAAAVLVARRREPDPLPPVVVRAPASDVRDGEVRVGDVPVTVGQTLRIGDAFTSDRRTVFERPGRVTWLVEPRVKAHVKAADASLVLGLDDGVIEADVVPVPSGEAFAIDVATGTSLVRVAVHGTHLRVARAGSRVTVDLTEGVIAIGVPPPSGTTEGTTVRAPAHVELDADDLSSIRVDALEVRPAVFGRPTEPAPIVNAVPAPSAVPRPRTLEPKRTESRRSIDALTLAVNACANTGSGRSKDVSYTVSTELRLRVSADGQVESAQFSPPLHPEIQACAAREIYGTKLDKTGEIVLPIEYVFKPTF